MLLGVESSLRSISPRQVRAILQRALAKRPGDRYSSALDFGNKLVRLAETLERRKVFIGRVSLLLRYGIGALVVGWIVVTVRKAIWPSPSDAIVFVSDEGGSEEIWVMNSDGSLRKRLTDDRLENIKPVWDPDREGIAFTSIASNGIFIRYVEYHSGDPKVVFSQCEDIEFGPSERIALSFWNEKGGNWDWDIAVLTGDTLQTVVSNEGDDFRPSWSPDERHLVYLSEVEGVVQIFRLDLTEEGKQPQQLTFDGSNWDPSWSPDGNLIVFSSTRTGEQELYVMLPNGSDQRALLDHQGNDFQPSWSPSGRQIAFTSDAEGNLDIYVVNLDGTGLKRLTDSSANEKMPYWGH